MILLDTDSFTLHQFGHDRFMARYQTAAEVPAITIVTEIEALRGRHDALLKAEDGPRLLRAQEGVLRTIRHLALFPVVPFDAAAGVEFDRLRQTKGVKKIGRADLLIAALALAPAPHSCPVTSGTSGWFPACAWRIGRTDGE